MKRIAQAGAITVKAKSRQSQVLLATAKDQDDIWIFPKGRLEPGETPEEAAIRELCEETGVVGEVLAPVGASRFRSGNEDIKVEYFLVRALKHGRSTEGRRLKWLPPAAARAQLSFEDARLLLDKALRIWRNRRERD